MSRSPLFDIYDPGGYLQQQAQFGLLPSQGEEMDPIGIVPLGPRKPTLSDLMPAEEKKGWLRTLASMGSSGLAGLGWLLDTPGAVVRGTLSGGLGKGLSALWDTSDDRVTGRELARQYGLAGDKDNWGNFAGGLAAEFLLDPLTYGSLGLNAVLGKGAKTLAGRAAQHAGLLDDFDLYAKSKNMGTREAMRNVTPAELLARLDPAAQDLAKQRIQAFTKATNVNDVLSQPLAKMNRVSIPGLAEDAADFYGKGVGDFVAKTADRLGDAAKKNPYTGSVVRGAQAAFDPRVMGMTDYDRQWEARSIYAARKAREQADRATLIPLQMGAENYLRRQGKSLNDADVSSAIRNYAEHGIDAIPPELNKVFDAPEMRDLLHFWDDYRDSAIRDADALGIPLNEFKSRAGTGFFPRQQSRFDVVETPAFPAGVVPPERLKRSRYRGGRVVEVGDTGGQRRDYTDVMGGTATINRMSLDPELQARLRGATNEQAREILDNWAARNNDGAGLYDWIDDFDPETGEFSFTPPALPSTHPLMARKQELNQLAARAKAAGDDGLAATLNEQIKGIDSQIPAAARDAYREGLYADLADFTRTLDPQHVSRQHAVFGQNAFNEMAGYVMGRGRSQSDAQSLWSLLKDKADRQGAEAITGGVNYTAYDTLKKLGLTGESATDVLTKQLGVDSLDDISFNKKFVDDWSRVIERGKAPPEISPILEKIDDFTKSFKTLALLWPSRYTRDLYSGMIAAAAKGAWNPFDWWRGKKIRQGNYLSLPNLLRSLPDYAGLDDEGIVRKFLADAGKQGLGTSTVADELTQGIGGAAVQELYPGMARPRDVSDIMERAKQAKLIRGWNPLNSDWSPFAVRGSGGNRNPLLEAGDRLAETTDAANRYGTYLNQIRKGAAPEEAARIADLTQVNYRNSTNIERDVLKRAVPFYSYSRGILPLIADQLIDQPQGLLGKSTRAINRASEPSEESFTPEYLRQSAAIPVPSSFPLVGLDPNSPLTRFLANIDLPWESVINLFTPGTGNTLFDKIGNSARKTALNLLGQTNPLIKGPLELATNRQFYSGRQLSDLYSMLEQPLGSPGRVAEQVISNLPGGSRVLGTVRQAMDQRLTPQERAAKIFLKALTGLALHDVDRDRTKRLAARDMLNQLLETTPGVRTFENIDIPPDVLAKMPEDQKRMFLLYRIIQSESAKRARDRKKQEMALDPMQVLGLTRQI